VSARATLAAALRDAVRALDFAGVVDGALREESQGAPRAARDRARLAAPIAAAIGASGRAPTPAQVRACPSLDLAVAVFPHDAAPLWADVLFSREHPQGLIADIDDRAGAVRGIRFERDLQDADGRSVAWLPGADWSRLAFAPLRGAGPARFVAPYPASLLKLMVAVGVGLAVDRGRCAWPADLVEPMITVSSNDATDALVALLHRVGAVALLHEAFARCGLPTLRLDDTTPAGGWRNAQGAGVGHIHMTAWDTVRLLWLLDAAAPPAPWLAPGTAPLLQPATRDALRAALARQQRNEILSSQSLAGVPGWIEGIPARARFAHKTGNTENYASDAGIVEDGGLHYIVALTSSLGRRHAPHPRCATSWRLPALGAAVHRIVSEL